jgi:protein arginine N-methyltransferase 1
VRPGDTVDVRLQALPADLLLTWRGTVTTAEGATRFSHSTLGGMLFTRDDLRRLRPDQAPRLTERGRARLTVLQLCDGERPLLDIEREVRHRHPALFRTDEDAAVFVTEVVSRYSE